MDWTSGGQRCSGEPGRRWRSTERQGKIYVIRKSNDQSIYLPRFGQTFVFSLGGRRQVGSQLLFWALPSQRTATLQNKRQKLEARASVDRCISTFPFLRFTRVTRGSWTWAFALLVRLTRVKLSYQAETKQLQAELQKLQALCRCSCKQRSRGWEYVLGALVLTNWWDGDKTPNVCTLLPPLVPAGSSFGFVRVFLPCLQSTFNWCSTNAKMPSENTLNSKVPFHVFMHYFDIRPLWCWMADTQGVGELWLQIGLWLSHQLEPVALQ